MSYRRGPYTKGSTKKSELSDLEPMKEILKETRRKIKNDFPCSEVRSKIISNLQGLLDYLVKRQNIEKRTENKIQEEILERLYKIEKRLDSTPSFSSIFNDLEGTSEHHIQNSEQNYNIINSNPNI
jgi:hypothetical protein